MRVEWRPSALADLIKIVQAIALDNPRAAQELKDEIQAKTENLIENPKLYKVSSRVPGTREMVIRPNYIVFYRDLPDRVLVINVVHARRKWPA